MNILIVIPTDSLGGAENYLKMIATYHKDENIDIYFFKNNKRELWNDAKLFANLNFISPTHEIIGVIKFCFIMFFKRKSYDYIYTSQIYTNALIGILKSLGIVKSKYFIARESTSIFIRFKGIKLFFYKSLILTGYRKMDLLICQTKLMKSQFINHFSKIEKRTLVKVIPNPIDLKKSNTQSQEKLDSVFSGNCIVTAGRLIELKGYDLLINAFAELKQEFPELKLVLLGRGSLKDELQNQVNSLNLQNDVIFAGFVNNVYNYFLKAKLCVISSQIEGFPNVLLQMMSQNTKVVSTLCAGGIEDINGIYTCQPNSHNKLKTAIHDCLLADTSKNRIIFDNYLTSISIEKFIITINDIIK